MATSTNASQDPWELAKARFLEDLEPQEKELFINATLENIYYSTSNINREDGEKSKTRGVVRKLGPLVSAIESYGGVGDALAQISPQYLSPIWGSIRIVLVAASSYTKFYEKIVDTLGRIGDILPRFRDYERIYNRQKHKRLYQALSNTYLDIVTLCHEFRKSIREQNNSKVRRILRPLAFDKQSDEAIDRFRQHRQNVVEEAETCHLIEAAEQREAQLVLFAEERRRKLLARLSKVNWKHRHRKLKESRHEGTGVWFTSCSEYEDWQATSESSVLCCYGIPGCGKSVLVSSVIDSFDANGTLVFYYCDYADKRTLEPSNVFATMARQALEKVEILPETLASEIEQADHDGERLTNPSQSLILLQKSLELVPGPVFLVLDGLDEATESSQTLMCSKLKHLIEKYGFSVKLLITAREELGPLFMLDPSIPFSRVPISPNAISLDIENYVRASTRRRISDGSLVISDSDLEQLIVSELVNGAKGMFLWVEFQLHDLCEPESDHGIRLVLQNLPRSLSETYNRLLNRIEGVERKDMIQRMFKWIVCAREPIHLEELREAIAFTLEDLAYDSGKLPTDLNRLIRACGNLVVVDEETQIIQLAHHTVQQYLLQQDGSPFQFTIKDANVMAGEFCVAYLSFANFESQVTRYAENKNTDMLALGKIASRGPMLRYDHPGQKVVRILNSLRTPRSNGLELDMTLYVPPQKTAWQPANFTFLSYVVSHWLWHTIFFYSDDEGNDSQETRRDRLFKNLILRKQLLIDFRPWGNFKRDARESSSISLVGWALMANHRYLIQMASSDIALPSPKNAWDATCTRYFWETETALWPIYGPPTPSGVPSPYHLNIMDLDYDPSYTSDSPNLIWLFSRLSWACKRGHLDAIKEFNVENFRNIKAVDFKLDHDCMIEYLLVAAAASGELQVVKYLSGQVSTYRAFSVVSDLTKGSALAAIEHAAISGYIHVVSYLADQDRRPVNIFNLGLFQKFFDEAIRENNSRTVESLLSLRSLGVDRNIGHSSFHISNQHLSNILVEVIQDGHEDVVRLMLKHGVDPDRPHVAGSTPLIEAIRHSRDSIVSMLLEYACSLGNTSVGMPLTVAACVGNLSAVRELILHGAEVFGEPSESENLIAMAYTDNLFTSPGGSGHQASRDRVHLSPTPLYMACYHGNLDIVQLLLHYGAASNFPSPATIIRMTQRVASSAILDCYFNEILLDSFSNRELLLSNRKSVVVGAANWGLPITIAMARGNEDIVSILLSSGALWPEEFDCLYGSCFGSLDSQLENLANHVIYSLVTGSLLPKNDTTETYRTEKTGNIRARMMEMGMPTVTANRIHSPAELRNATAITTASEKQFLKLQQESNRRRIQELKYVARNSNLTGLDLKAAGLVEAARNYPKDREDLLIEALVHGGASLTTRDENGVCVPHTDLVAAAKCGNITLRHALLELGVAAAVSFVNGTPNGRNPCGHEELERRYSSLERIVRSTALRIYPYPKTIDRIRSYCEILTFGVYNNDMSFIHRLYENLMFPSPNFPRWAELSAVVDHGESKLVELLCKLGGNVHSRDYNGATPLMFAVERGVKDVVEVLLDLGANPTDVDNAGENALYKAAISNERDAITSLIRANYAFTDRKLDAELFLCALDTALARCVSNGKPDTWRNLTRASRDRDPIFSEAVAPLYCQARAIHLLRRPCHHVQGLFELFAVQDEDKVQFQTVSLVEDAEETKRSRGLSEAAAAVLEAGARGDALLGLTYEF